MFRTDDVAPASVQSLVARADFLCDEGLALQALELLGPLEASGEPNALAMGVRIRSHVGDARGAEARAILLYRRFAQSPAAILAYGRFRACRTSYDLWRFVRDTEWPATATAAETASWQSLQAYLYGWLRDFERAQTHFDKARALAPSDPWIFVEWTYVCEMRDRLDEALSHAEQALALMPNHRSAAQMYAHLLVCQGREQDALEFLDHYAERCENGAIARQLFELQMELGLFEAAQTSLQWVRERHPLCDKHTKASIAARDADLAMHLADFERARASSALVNWPFYDALRERLADAQANRRVLLPVGFVKQHWMTCAPATLTSIALYWGKPAHHIEIAEEICYDGTPNHSERKWAEDAGFITCEFTVDWASAKALIDAGVPFTLTTIGTGAGHLQAVIGYDELRHSLLIRDPNTRTHGEFEVDGFLKHQSSSGPRGMLLVPAEEAHRIANLQLPDAHLWDGYHAVMAALSRHEREQARRAVEHLVSLDAQHTLCIWGKRALAMYDGDEASLLTYTETLLQRYPDDVNLQLSKAASLHAIGGRAAHLEWLGKLASAARPDPQILVRYAERLAEDARRYAQARRLVERALKQGASDATTWAQLGQLMWQAGETVNALPIYRIASCVQDTSEAHAASYFSACYMVRRVDEALHYLEQRVERLGKKSSGPACTLADQLERLERIEDAFAVLDAAVAAHPDDANLKLYYAEVRLRYGDTVAARDLLAQAEKGARRGYWLRVQALIERANENFDAALAHAQAACELEPLNVAQHRLTALLFAQQSGRDAAVDYLRGICAKFAHHYGLHRLLYDWLPDSADDIEKCLRHIAATHPGDVWVLRELAIQLARARKFDEAQRFAKAALARADWQAETHCSMYYVAQRAGADDARKHLQRAVELSIDNDYALTTFIQSGATLAQRRQALDFVRSELTRQVTLGDGLLSFQSAAQGVLSADELLHTLQDALAERPELWHAWVAVIAQLNDMGRYAQALELAIDAEKNFALLPRLLFEHARAYLLQGDTVRCREVLERVFLVSPAWSSAVRMYVDAVCNEGRMLERAEAVLLRALRRDGDNADMRGLLAWLYERMDRKQDAAREARTSLLVDPSASWVWALASRVMTEAVWGAEGGTTRSLAEDIVAKRPGDVLAWVALAQQSEGSARATEAIERALSLEPLSQTVWDTRLSLLMRAQRYHEIDTLLCALPWPEQAPATVRAFGARVLRERGQRSEAIEQLRKLLEDEPNHYGLWRDYADWCDEADKNEEYVGAAQNMVRIAPNESTAHGFLGHALLKLERKQTAMLALQRALQLDPAYLFAGLRLADLALEAPDARTAQLALDSLAAHHRNPHVAARQVKLHILRQDKVAALAAAGETFALAEREYDAVETVLQAIDEAQWSAALQQVIRDQIAAGRCAARAVDAWIAREREASDEDSLTFAKRMKSFAQKDPSHVLKQGLLAWAGRNIDYQLMRMVIENWREDMRADSYSWSLVVWALLSHDERNELFQWLKGWEQRQNIPAWGLDAVAASLRLEGRDADARCASERAVEIEPSGLEAQVWFAFDAAYRGRHGELTDLLGKIDEAQLNRYFGLLLRIMRVYLRGVEAGKSGVVVGELRKLALESDGNPVAQRLLKRLKNTLLRDFTGPVVFWLRWIQFAVT